MRNVARLPQKCRAYILNVSGSTCLNERRLMRFQKMLSVFQLLIIDELGFVPLSKTGAELLFEVFSRRYERSATLVTSNLPFNEWTEAFGSERVHSENGRLVVRMTAAFSARSAMIWKRNSAPKSAIDT